MPALGQATSRIDADGHARLVQWPQLAQVSVGLLQVIAEDLLELERAVALGVDLVGPAHEPQVQIGARALEQAVVDGVAHQVVVKAVDRLRLRHRSTGR